MKPLTARQREAVESDAPLTVCVAGPGSGKTHTLAARVDRLVRAGGDPRRIAVLTFTNAAARELERRLQPPRPGYVGTLHSYALRALRDHGAGIGYGDRLAVVDEDAAEDLLTARAKSLGCKTSRTRLLELKRRGVPALRSPAAPAPALDEIVVAAYYRELRDAGLVDLDSVLPEFLRLISGPAAPGVPELDDLLVDEVQDSSESDWAIYDALPARRKFLVGDPDQAIYSFRGGRQDLMVRAARAPGARVVALEENFRCAPAVCAAANRLIARNEARLPKATVPAGGSALAGRVDSFAFGTEGEEVAAVCRAVQGALAGPEPAPGLAVLARSNSVALGFREALEAAGVAVEGRREADPPRDLALARSLIELLGQPDNDALAFFYVCARERARGLSAKDAREKAAGVRLEAARAGRTLNQVWFRLPRRPGLPEVAALLEREGVSAQTRALIADRAAILPPGSGVLELAAELAVAKMFHEGHSDGVAPVFVGTVHAAKGREWDRVFLVGMEEELSPGAAALAPTAAGRAALEEERRVWFVGITRARAAVTMTSADQRRATWGRQELLARTRSRFVGEALS